jgi:hypothetical protein
VGKLKKVGIGFGIVILSFFVLAAIGGSVPDTEKSESKSTVLDKFKAKSHEEMNSSELSLIAVQHDFKDLMRNIDDYSGKIIFVEGVVTNVQRDIGLLNLCVDGATVSFYCDEFMFVEVNGINTWLEEDNLAGYVEVIGLGGVSYSSVFTGGEKVESGDYVPQVKEIKLTCSNC